VAELLREFAVPASAATARNTDGLATISVYTVARASSYIAASGYNNIGFIISNQSNIGFGASLMAWNTTFP
jgi:hypothetical protein